MGDHYSAAQKLALKEYRKCVSRGEYPYLPVLDGIVSQEQIARGRAMGLQQIPADLIVGTRTEGRSNVFARNFMPLAQEHTEFSAKWLSLCEAHLDEGIREPIKAYEYMNRYYVAEGNKRVSVLKFFDAVQIPGQVIRVMPERNGSEEVERYYELVEFSKYSKISYVEFSRLGRYAQLLQYLGKQPEEYWSEEERSRFSVAYYYFRQAFEACGGKQLSITVGDALLAYLDVYGYENLAGQTPSVIRAQVEKTWEEISLQQEQPAIDLKLDPSGAKTGLLSKVLPKTEPKVLKVAFIHDKAPELSGWINAHERGRRHVQEAFGGAIETTAYFFALDQGADETIDKAIADGNTVIFTTSPRLTEASLKAAVEHPKITILNCSLNQSHRYIRTYYARMYEAKYIAGIIAGVLTDRDDVGYICDYPIYGQVAGINAFALGVQTVNPRVKVHLEWSSVGGVKEAAQRLLEQGVRLISSQDLTRLRDDGRTPFGLSIVTEEGMEILAKPVWQWGVYYERILRRIRDKRFQSEYQGSSKALNYFWGMSAGVVQMRYYDALPQPVRKLAQLTEKSICAGLCQPFIGPVYDQAGQEIVGREEDLSPEQVIDMHWLCENVVGRIPTYDELTETGKETVRSIGFTLPE